MPAKYNDLFSNWIEWSCPVDSLESIIVVVVAIAVVICGTYWTRVYLSKRDFKKINCNSFWRRIFFRSDATKNVPRNNEPGKKMATESNWVVARRTYFRAISDANTNTNIHIAIRRKSGSSGRELEDLCTLYSHVIYFERAMGFNIFRSHSKHCTHALAVHTRFFCFVLYKTKI